MHPIRKALCIKFAILTGIVGFGVAGIYKILELLAGESEWFAVLEENQLLILGFFGIFYLPILIYLKVIGSFLPDSHWEKWKEKIK